MEQIKKTQKMQISMTDATWVIKTCKTEDMITAIYIIFTDNIIMCFQVHPAVSHVDMAHLEWTVPSHVTVPMSLHVTQCPGSAGVLQDSLDSSVKNVSCKPNSWTTNQIN